MNNDVLVNANDPPLTGYRGENHNERSSDRQACARRVDREGPAFKTVALRRPIGRTRSAQAVAGELNDAGPGAPRGGRCFSFGRHGPVDPWVGAVRPFPVHATRIEVGGGFVDPLALRIVVRARGHRLV